MESEESVISGPWFDHNGTTIWDTHVCTLKIRYFGFLNNFLVIFLTLVAERFWVLLAYAIHQMGSHGEPRDGMRRSMEVFIRNASALDVVLSGWKILRRWRYRSTRKTWYKCFMIFLIALGTLAGFQSAGIYTNRIRLGSIVRLRSSSTCGLYRPAAGSLDTTLTNAAKDIDVILKSTINKRGLIDSTGYALKDLWPLLNATAIDCPFDPQLCATSNNQTAIKIDSGAISIRQFGINSPEEVTVRRVHQCAVLSNSGQLNSNGGGRLNLTATSPSLNESFGIIQPDIFYYQYGLDNITVTQLQSNIPRDEFRNLTFWYSRSEIFSYDYVVWGENARAESAYDRRGGRDWFPLPEFYAQGGSYDLSIVFTAINSISFPDRVEDPYFYARTSDAYPGRVTRDPLDPISTLACTQQLEACWSANQNASCTGLLDIESFFDRRMEWGFTDLQYNLLKSYMIAAVQWYDVGRLAQIRRENLLLVADDLYNGVAKQPKQTQWIDEIRNMMAFGMIGAMYELRAYATGIGAEVYRDVPQQDDMERITMPETEDPICLNDYITVDAPLTHITFSLIPVVIIFAVGLVIIILSLVLEPILAHILVRFPKTRRAALVWRLDSTLQLFRFTMEAAGADKWDRGLIGSVPLTVRDEKMAIAVRAGRSVYFKKVGDQVEPSEINLGWQKCSLRDLNRRNISNEKLIQTVSEAGTEMTAVEDTQYEYPSNDNQEYYSAV
ncbi:hypothetical protein ABW19_dt0209883 [Dactylella cylindrospora]|nr:hypothetical protein ABW19_dt0209883 [Dactylella cylindrospora]